MRRHRLVLLGGAGLFLLCVCAGLAVGASFFFGSHSPCGGGVGTLGSSTTVAQGQTMEDVRACGGDVLVRGHVTGDVAAYGGNVTISSSGRVDGAVNSYGGRVEVAGVVQGDVTSYGGGIVLDNSARINGDVKSYGGGVTKSPGAQVQGDIEHNPGSVFSLSNLFFWGPFDFSFPVVWIVVWMGIAAALAHWLPQRTLRIGEVMFSSLPRSLIVGVLSWVLGLILAAILAFTILGIPLTIAIILVLIAGAVMGNVAIGWVVGRGVLRRVFHRDHSPVLDAMVGVAILAFMESIPLVGFLLSVLVALLGVGATLLSRFGARRLRASRPWRSVA